MKKIIFGIFFLFALLSCTKKPEAKFYFDQYGGSDLARYNAGDVVKMTNTSKDAVRYEWELPDGRIVTDKDAEFTIPLNYIGIYDVKLTAFSKKDRHSNTLRDGFMVNGTFGMATFWKSSSCACGDVTVSITPNCAGSVALSGTLTADFSSAPPSSSPGAASFGFHCGGPHTYFATDGTKSWNGNFTITNGCDLKIQLN